MGDWLCWALLAAVIVYFVRIDRKLRAMNREFSLLTNQLKKWGFVKPE